MGLNDSDILNVPPLYGMSDILNVKHVTSWKGSGIFFGIHHVRIIFTEVVNIKNVRTGTQPLHVRPSRPLYTGNRGGGRHSECQNDSSQWEERVTFRMLKILAQKVTFFLKINIYLTLEQHILLFFFPIFLCHLFSFLYP